VSVVDKIRRRTTRTFWRWRVTLSAEDFDTLCRLAESASNPNARLEWDGQEPSENDYPPRIWFTPEDNSSRAYIRLDLHLAALGGEQ